MRSRRGFSPRAIACEHENTDSQPRGRCCMPDPSPSYFRATMLSVTFFVSRLHRSAKSGKCFSRARHESIRSGATRTAEIRRSGRRRFCARAGARARRRSASDAAPLAELGYGQVRLADGPLARQAQENHRFVLALDEDALLYPFRKRAGLAGTGQRSRRLVWHAMRSRPAPRSANGSRRWRAITPSAAMRRRAKRSIVWSLVTRRRSAMASTRTTVFRRTTYDKLTLGLIDAKQYAGNRDALAALRRTTQTAVPFLPPRAMPRMEHDHPAQQDFTEHVLDESYTIPEYQFLAWKLTGDRAASPARANVFSTTIFCCRSRTAKTRCPASTRTVT